MIELETQQFNGFILSDIAKFDVVHARQRWSGAASQDDFINRIRRPDKNGLDIAGRQISNPTRQSKILRTFRCPGPEPDTLNPALDQYRG